MSGYCPNSNILIIIIFYTNTSITFLYQFLT
ncbi:Uncharacterised protein [Segatella copri]|nr:Uncharacterised protein [Segatella copri]